MVSFWDLVLLFALFAVLNAGLLYFVIKAAVKNALTEDRVFQAKVRSARDGAAGQPTQ